MSGGVNNQNGLFRQANGYGPFQQRAQQVLGQKKGSGSKNLFLKTQEDLIEDATYRTVGKIVDEEPRLGKNPHVVNSFKHHRSNVAARIALNANKGSDYVDKAWAKQAKDSQAKKSDRKFATIDNDPVAKSAKPALSLEEKIERLEQKVANLEENQRE